MYKWIYNRVRLSKIILAIGTIGAITYGFVFQSVTSEYMNLYLRDPSLYPLRNASYEYNFVGALTIFMSAFLIGALFFLLETIVENQIKLIKINND